MNRILFRKLVVAGALICCTLLLAGCSRSAGSVKGKVTYNGKPLKGGSVSFVSEEGQASSASEIAEDGTYNVPKLISGTYKVCVDTSFLKAAGAAASGYGAVRPGGPAPKDAGPPAGATVPEGYKPSSPADASAAAAAKKYVEIPAKYKDAGTTDLSFTGDGSAQTYDIDLK